jgi:hypothetical protein
MKCRCYNPKDINYLRYGGRGITVCDRWRDSFTNFLADMGECPKRLTLDRIDNDGNYEAGNCRWATPKQQQRNKRYNLVLTHNGRTQCLKAWAEETGLNYNTLHGRLRNGWSVSEALTTPARCYAS